MEENKLNLTADKAKWNKKKITAYCSKKCAKTDWRVKKKKKEQKRSLMLSVFSWECKNMQRLLAPEQIESGQEDKAQRRRITLHVFFNPSIYVSSAQVRIFPYLIGRESAFADNLKWMACANKGLGLFDKHFSGQLPIRVSRTFWCGVSAARYEVEDVSCLCGLAVCVCVLRVFPCVYVLAQTLSAKRQWSGTWAGKRSIRSNPSSCQSVSPLAAHCWWLPRVYALDECPLEGKVAARKTDHRATVGRRAPNILPYTNPHCGVTLHVQYEALSATAGADSKSNGSCVALSWATGSLFPVWFSEVRDISRHGK